MPNLSELTDYEMPAPEPIPANIPRVYIGSPGIEDRKEEKGIVQKVTDKLLGLNGEERYQLWPEKVVREGLSAAGDVFSGQTPQWGVDPVTGDVHTSLQMIEKAQAISALAGTGGLAGAEEGAVLNATPSLRPALKYKDKLYKGKPGQEHQDVIPAHLYPEFQQMAMSGEDISHYNFGFVNDKGHFLDRESALKYGIDNGLIDPQAGKYGALTSTLMADSSKPGMAIEAMAKADPFFSALEHNVKNISQTKMNGDAWLGTLSNKPGVKPEELQWTGLKDFLESNKGKPVTKEQIEQHLASNKVELKEVGLADKSNLDPVIRYLSESFESPHIKTSQDIVDARKYNSHFKETTKGMSDEEIFAAIEKSNQFRNVSPTKYHSYQLPGGENYREMLMTLPDKKVEAVKSINTELINKYGSLSDAFQKWTPDEQTKFDAIHTAAQSFKNGDKYTSSHWDEANILAHVRMNDRTIDGKKSLHLEEIQSDWHQQGRDKGYSNPKAQATEEEISKLVKADSEARIAASAATEKAWKEATNGKAENQRQWTDTGIDRHELRRAQEYVNDSKERQAAYDKTIETHRALNEAVERGKVGVPDAPFKKTWHELALKRMIREAAEKGYDRLSWTPGEAQAARYDLSKKINDIQIKPASEAEGGKHVTLNAPSGVHGSATVDGSGKIIRGFDAFGGGEGKNLSDFVGKDLATKILKTEGETKLAGDGLKVGGEGMKGFYDNIIPKAVEKLGKEHGVKVKQANLTDAPKYEMKNPILNKEGKEIISVYKDGTFMADMEKSEAKHYIETKQKSDKPSTAHYIDIPTSLRDTAIGKGFPLFSSSHVGFTFTPVSHNPFEEKKK